MNWYYAEQGKQAGPVDQGQFEELVHKGKIQPDTMVWREGMADWMTYREVAAEAKAAGLRLAPVAPVESAAPRPQPAQQRFASAKETENEASEAVCSQCGKIFPLQETIRHGDIRVCALCKPAFMQKMAGARNKSMAGAFNYAGFWIRVVAKIVDGLILGVVLFSPACFFLLRAAMANPNPEKPSLLPLVILFLCYLILIAYEIFFIGKYGATPGKMVCKIKVITADGGRVSYLRATGRSFADKLSGMICYIGYIMAGFNQEKRALHDFICDTRVIYK